MSNMIVFNELNEAIWFPFGSTLVPLMGFAQII